MAHTVSKLLTISVTISLPLDASSPTIFRALIFPLCGAFCSVVLYLLYVSFWNCRNSTGGIYLQQRSRYFRNKLYQKETVTHKQARVALWIMKNSSVKIVASSYHMTPWNEPAKLHQYKVIWLSCFMLIRFRKYYMLYGDHLFALWWSCEITNGIFSI